MHKHKIIQHERENVERVNYKNPFLYEILPSEKLFKNGRITLVKHYFEPVEMFLIDFLMLKTVSQIKFHQNIGFSLRLSKLVRIMKFFRIYRKFKLATCQL